MRTSALLVLLSGVLASAQDAPPPEEVRPVQRWSGDRTNIAGREILRITDSAEWTKLWERHEGKHRKAPVVDFERNLVVAAFLGKVEFEKIDVHQVKRTREELVVGLEVGRDDCCDFSAIPLWMILVLPKCELPMSVILRVRGATGIEPRKDEILSEFPAIR